MSGTLGHIESRYCRSENPMTRDDVLSIIFASIGIAVILAGCFTGVLGVHP